MDKIAYKLLVVCIWYLDIKVFSLWFLDFSKRQRKDKCKDVGGKEGTQEKSVGISVRQKNTKMRVIEYEIATHCYCSVRNDGGGGRRVRNDKYTPTLSLREALRRSSLILLCQEKCGGECRWLKSK